MSLIQSRMSIERALLWAKVVTFVGAFFALGNLVYYSTTLRGWDLWSIGLSGFLQLWGSTACSSGERQRKD
ncbi:hypothetical protein FHX48_001241 [Microbacterium halimionae]|uniref:Uncharacterized protein n=1 Tax=Microbacterium halimionae TaxID=1526413 RepID=A0A7W3JNW5_9MICO|nr:hypothetical protein [Microbacterium halimionae]NII96370.1 hypothetical protein [Microbacterium halimionae]